MCVHALVRDKHTRVVHMVCSNKAAGRSTRAKCANRKATVFACRLQANSVGISEVRGRDGSLLDADDRLVDSVDDMEELVAVLERLGASSPRQHTLLTSPAARRHVPNSVSSHVRAGSETDDHVTATGAPQGAGASAVGADDAANERHGADENWRSNDGEEPLDAWAKDTFRTTCVDGHSGGITCVHMEAGTAVTGGRDKLLRIWDCEAQSVVQVLQGHTGNVRCVQVQKGLILSGGEPVIRVWDAHTGRQTAALEGHAHYVSCLHVDSDLRLVTGSWDRTLRIWSLPSDGSATVRA